MILKVLFLLGTALISNAHNAKDFDDSVLYRIDFELPDLDDNPNHLKTFVTHEKEKYECVIPVLENKKEKKEVNEQELSPFTVMKPVFALSTCTYRVEAYWSYEICHGHYIRQYHEEREGKSIKTQEYFLGKWNDEKTAKLMKSWEEERKAGMKYKTTKIDNTKYPYFELEMNDGTPCDIISAPRTTIVRYVCYPYGKNDIYSFKETSSCNYEIIILTTALCMIPAFHPEESKEISIKCSNTPTLHKPLSLLRQELSEMQLSEDDFPVSKEASAVAAILSRNTASGDRYMFLNKFEGDVDKLVLELMAGVSVDVETDAQSVLDSVRKTTKPAIVDLTPIRDFISGKNCLTGGTGWWKYEFCYGRHVRQFHKDKKAETELFLGFFTENSHRDWVAANPEKGLKRSGQGYLWHHYEQGTLCDRTGQPREVDVKLTCTAVVNSSTSVSMYLLEPKTCQYILVVESPVVCDLIQLSNEFGLVSEEHLQQLLEKDTLGQTSEENDSKPKKENEVLSEVLPQEDVRE